MDAFLDHALVCSCGGDRTLRYNAVRNDFFDEAQAAGVRCEKEKLNLLPPRLDDESLRGEDAVNGRRPADVWLAHWSRGRVGAIDFAVNSGLRNDVVGAAAQEPTVVSARYENIKRGHLRTQTQCNESCDHC